MSEAALSANSQNQSIQTQLQKDFKSSDVSNLADQLFRDYGVQNVLDAVNNAAAGYLIKELGSLVNDLDMPQFMKDDANHQIRSVSDSYKTDTSQGAQEGINKLLSQPSTGASGTTKSSGGDVVNNVMDMVKQSMQESTGSATGSSGSTGGSGNWLAVLAKALGQTAGKALENMVNLGKSMGGIDSKENPAQFAETQAEFQAQAQIFKMFQEAIATMIKSIGEGMSSVARKQ